MTPWSWPAGSDRSWCSGRLRSDGRKRMSCFMGCAGCARVRARGIVLAVASRSGTTTDKSAGAVRHQPTTWRRSMMTLRSWLIAALLAAFPVSSHAEEIAVGNYGVSANGMPFGVALVKGYFKEEGLNITGLISQAGGGP